MWERLASDLRPNGLDESITREVSLDDVDGLLDDVLAGKAVGRTRRPRERLTAVPERPKPDLDQTREALRKHDKREREDEEFEAEQAEPDEGEEKEPDSGASLTRRP